MLQGSPKDPAVDHSTTVQQEDSTTTEQPEDDPGPLQQEGVHVDTVNLGPVEGSHSVESGSPQGQGVKHDHSHVSVNSSQTPERSDHGSFDTLESMVCTSIMYVCSRMYVLTYMHTDMWVYNIMYRTSPLYTSFISQTSTERSSF